MKPADARVKRGRCRTVDRRKYATLTVAIAGLARIGSLF
jgi:hypothetical protein